MGGARFSDWRDPCTGGWDRIRNINAEVRYEEPKSESFNFKVVENNLKSIVLKKSLYMISVKPKTGIFLDYNIKCVKAKLRIIYDTSRIDTQNCSESLLKCLTTCFNTWEHQVKWITGVRALGIPLIYKYFKEIQLRLP